MHYVVSLDNFDLVTKELFKCEVTYDSAKRLPVKLLKSPALAENIRLSPDGGVYLNKEVMLKIGLTGEVGSGKTTVAKVFENLGVPVFYSDQEAKKCIQFNVALKEKIQSVFGKHLYEEGVFKRAIS